MTIQSVESALHTLSSAMRADPHYARGWHDNIAVMMQDAGADYDVSNDGAARFMKLAFGVTTGNETLRYHRVIAAAKSLIDASRRKYWEDIGGELRDLESALDAYDRAIAMASVSAGVPL